MIEYAAHVVTDADIDAVVAVLRSNRLTQGPTVERLEAKLCEVTGSRYAVAVSNGTMALWCAYRAFITNYKSLLLTSANTFVATVNAAPDDGLDLGLEDVDPNTGMANVAGGADWTAPVAVSIGGEIPPLRRRDTILDASHALGGPIPFDRIIAATVSFHPAKQVATGEGGAILTNDEGAAAAARQLRDNGRNPATGKTEGTGLNCRMDEMSAALALSQLDRLDATITRRRELASMYDEALRYVPGVIPVPHSDTSARHLYQIRLDDRDGLQQHLADCGVGTQVHYMPIYRHPYYSHLGKPADYPGAEEWWRTVLALPLHNGLNDRDVRYVCDAVKGYADCRESCVTGTEIGYCTKSAYFAH